MIYIGGTYMRIRMRIGLCKPVGGPRQLAFDRLCPRRVAALL